MRIRYLLILIGLVLLTPAQAQKRQKARAKAKTAATPVKKEPTAADLLYENMLSSIQQVFVIDSIVCPQAECLSHIPLPPECGQLMPTSQLMGSGDGFAYVNEFGNKAYFTVMQADSTSRLMTADRLQQGWSAPVSVEGIDQGLQPGFPFMMADGITLYFAQRGEGSLGGYDIFMTRYDSEAQRFFRPQNIGLPFNSRANDYLYIEDELDELGWFVSDRNQPDGMVCVYTFVPSKKRQNIDTSDMDEAEEARYASIASIRDTWPSEKERDQALDRLQQMRQRQLSGSSAASAEAFVINDRLSYTKAEQFRSPKARQLFLELQQLRKQHVDGGLRLEQLRAQYHQANASKRQQLSPTILNLEKEQEAQTHRIRQTEKDIRQAEMQAR